MARKQTRKLEPVPQENPAWLLEDPVSEEPDPPVVTRGSTILPFGALPWADFERMCRRLAATDGDVEQAFAYGVPGQAQYGIDVLVRKTDGTYEVWQTKRYRRFTATAVREAVDLFLKHKWADKASKFVLAVSCALDETGVVEALQAARDSLKTKGVSFEPLDSGSLTEKLRSEAVVVDDFFGRAWAKAVCTADSVSALSIRTSRFEVARLRSDLKAWYTSWIAAVDPGLPIADLGRTGKAAASIPLKDRYVWPDVLTRVSELDAPSSIEDSSDEAASVPAQGAASRSDREKLGGFRGPSVREQRTSIDRLLSADAKLMVIGDAGMGKTTLLRALALDILDEVPSTEAAKGPLLGYIPVWIPFPLWTRMAKDRPSPPAVEEVAVSFLETQSQPELAASVKRALYDQKVILLVDGLDEAADTAIAQTVATVLATFLEARKHAAIVTSRPHGVRATAMVAATWTRAELAPLSDPQRASLATTWLSVLATMEAEEGRRTEDIGRLAKLKLSGLVSALERSAPINKLSRTPLLLLVLLQLHRHNLDLPRSRFKAIEMIVDQLIEHQPRRREAQALSTSAFEGIMRQRDRLLCDFALGLQSGEMTGDVSDAAGEDAAVERAAAIIMALRDSGDREKAEEDARQVFVFAEERAGILVKKSSQGIGFLHLSIQEFLAARALYKKCSSEELVEFIHQNAWNGRWSETILYILYLERNDGRVGNYLRAIRSARAPDGRGDWAIFSLQCSAVFGDFSHDLATVREFAADIFKQAETSLSRTRRRQVLQGAVDGLSSESISGLCQSKLSEWIPDRIGYARRGVIAAFVDWPLHTHTACRHVALRAIAAGVDYVGLGAAATFAALSDSEGCAKSELLGLLSNAPSVDTMVSCMRALGIGWGDDEDVGKLSKSLRCSSVASLAVEAISIRAKRGETDLDDLTRFFETEFSERGMAGSYNHSGLIEHFAERFRSDFIKLLVDKLSSYHDRNPHDLLPILGAMVECDPTLSQIGPALAAVLKSSWALRYLFEDRFPSRKIIWTPDLTALVQESLERENGYFPDYEAYWVARVLPEEWLKKKLIGSLGAQISSHIWSAKALIEFWGASDSEVKTTLLQFLDRKPEEVAAVALELVQVGGGTLLRPTLLRSLKAAPVRSATLIRALSKISSVEEGHDDDEFFDAALAAGSMLQRGGMQSDQWLSAMIDTFPHRPEVRSLAVQELWRRRGVVDHVARAYKDDPEIRALVLSVSAPLDYSDREFIVAALSAPALADDIALDLLRRCRDDERGAVASTAALSYLECRSQRGDDLAAEVNLAEKELDAVGHDYGVMRLGAVLCLAAADRLDLFLEKKDHKDDPLTVPAVSMSYPQNNELFSAVVKRWPYFVTQLGDESTVIARLEITAETALEHLVPGDDNAAHIFDLLWSKAPTTLHLADHSLLTALSRFRPGSPELQAMILEKLAPLGHSQFWGGLIAGELFADQFAANENVKQQVIDYFKVSPEGYASAALAEMLSRTPDKSIEDLLRDGVRDIPLDHVTYMKLVSVLASPDDCVQAICETLEEFPSRYGESNIARWLPTVARRLERDPSAREALRSAISSGKTGSLDVTLISLLAASQGGADEWIRATASARLAHLLAVGVPEASVDPTSGVLRPSRQILEEVLD